MLRHHKYISCGYTTDPSSILPTAGSVEFLQIVLLFQGEGPLWTIFDQKSMKKSFLSMDFQERVQLLATLDP